MISFGSGKTCAIYRFQYNSCVKDQLVLAEGYSQISVEGYWKKDTKLCTTSGSFFLCDTWLRYLKKLQFMLTETRQISNLRSQDASTEIRSDLAKKTVAKFSDKFFHFQYSSREMCKESLNNYSMLKLRFFNQDPDFCNIL